MKKHSPYKLYFYTAGILITLFAGFVFYYANKFLSSNVNLIQKIILSYFLAINLTTLVLYLYDKIISGSKKLTRVPELVLHILALLGGSPTALISQKIFHHKTSKKKFQIIYWLIVLAQVAISLWWINEISLK